VLDNAKGLRAIARCGVGFDAIDLDRATERGVAVVTTPGANAASVADFTLMLMLACVRRLLLLDRAVRTGDWCPEGYSADLTGATVGIVGLGHIGRAVATRLRGFGCRVLAAEPAPDLSFCQAHDVELRSFEELLPEVDILTVHAPLSNQTLHLIGERELAAMRRGAVVINTSRGGTIDERALVAALKDGHIGAAAVDVFEREPLPPDHPLTRLDNVILSGHAASLSGQGIRQIMETVVANLLELHAGRLPVGCVNPQVWPTNNDQQLTAAVDASLSAEPDASQRP
jgi:phosphoglycerate dehydrogenase-like enzyme